MIPKVIHAIWFGGPKTKLAQACRASWTRFAPDWSVKEWNAEAAEKLRDEPGYAFFMAALAARKWAMASDWLRMAALKREGGVYFDLDVELVVPFVPPEGEWVAGEWTASGATWMNPGSGLALEKDSAIARGMLEAYGKTVFDPKRDMMPWINAQMEKIGGESRWRERLRVLAPEVLSPIDMHGRLHRTAATLGVHHYALSWGGPGRKLLQWLSWHGFRWAIDLAVHVKHGFSSRYHPTPYTLHPSLVASFWEEHCLECGMPVCYWTCAMFERGWHGRCVRVDGFEESMRGTGTWTFRRWGKVEMMYHGRMTSARCAAALERLNLELRPVWRLLGMRHRAVRWRLAAWCGSAGAPNVWQLRLKGERAEKLGLSIAYEDGCEVWREALALAPSSEMRFRFDLPPVEDGALFRIFPLNGEATARIEVLENWVGYGAHGVRALPGMEDPAIKCVAWDLDGVVWKGTLSEGEDVKVRSEVLETIKALDARGIVSAICSKNDEAAALAKLRALGIEEWFVFPQINWGPKSESLKALARQMNIGLDAIAFVDDRAENRNEAAAHASGVRVMDERFAALREIASRPIEPGTLGSARRQAYRAEMARQTARTGFAGNAEAFNAASGLEVTLLPVTDENKVRCRELVNRTNQLNMSGRRYDEDAFEALVARDETRCVRVCDKYGDYGIVGFVAYRGKVLDELCFSCRVACRGVEARVLRSLVGTDGKLVAKSVRTERNGPLLKILEDFT